MADSLHDLIFGKSTTDPEFAKMAKGSGDAIEPTTSPGDLFTTELAPLKVAGKTALAFAKPYATKAANKAVEKIRDAFGESHDRTKPVLTQLAKDHFEAHTPIAKKHAMTRPFAEKNAKPWWDYDAYAVQNMTKDPNGNWLDQEIKKDMDAQSQWLMQDAGISREEAIQDSKPVYRGAPVTEENLPPGTKFQTDPNAIYGRTDEAA